MGRSLKRVFRSDCTFDDVPVAGVVSAAARVVPAVPVEVAAVELEAAPTLLVPVEPVVFEALADCRLMNSALRSAMTFADALLTPGAAVGLRLTSAAPEARAC